MHIADDGSLFVADYGNFCVVRFGAGDSQGQVVAGVENEKLADIDYMKDLEKTTFSPVEGEGRMLKRPSDVFVDDDGAVIALDTEACRAQKFHKGILAKPFIPPPDVPPQKSVHNPDSIKYPRFFAKQQDHSTILVDTWSHRVLMFPAPGDCERETPRLLAGVPNSCGSTPEKLAFPSSVAVGADGSLFVADTNNHRVQRFPCPTEAEPCADSLHPVGVTVAGNAEGKSGDGLGDLNMPTGICIDSRDGSLIVADRGNSRVLRFADGESTGSVIAGPEMVWSPWGVLADGKGCLYISDARRALVLKLDLDVAHTESASLKWSSPPPVPVPVPAAPPAVPEPSKGAPVPPRGAPPEMPVGLLGEDASELD